MFFPKNAHAYVDPGIISMMTQWGYILISGVVLVLFVNPWNYLKGLFAKKKTDSSVAEEKK